LAQILFGVEDGFRGPPSAWPRPKVIRAEKKKRQGACSLTGRMKVGPRELEERQPHDPSREVTVHRARSAPRRRGGRG